MSVPSESTAGREEVRRAIAQTRRNVRETDNVVSSTAVTLERLRAVNTDHLADRLRDIIRGAA